MNITAYNPQNRNQKFTIRYRPSYDQVIEGKFVMIDEHDQEITLSENTLYTRLKYIFCTEQIE